jgi:outer membrane protein assembly factor BamB
LLALLAVPVFTVEVVPQAPAGGGAWRQWGGPTRDFISTATGLADTWPAGGPPRLWSRPLGLGHSAVVVDDGRLSPAYRPAGAGGGGGAARFEAREVVVAIDAATGETIWEHAYDAEPLNFRFGAGPHATPLIVGDRLFAAGTNKQVHALDTRTGAVLWSRDLVAELGAPPTLARPAVTAGYGVSPLAFEDTIILQVGGPGQSVVALRQSDGEVAWRSGDFLIAHAAPILIDVDGQTQVVIFGGQTVNGLDPRTGELLWSHPHDTDGDMNNSTPIWGPDNVLFLSSAYNQGSRALRLSRRDGATRVEELWFTGRVQLMFSNAVRLGDHVYGTDGAFGPGFFTAIDARTGAIAWQERGFGRSSLLWADGKVIVLDEDGRLVLARVSPEGLEILAETPLFDTVSWTVPTLVGTTLYARDREQLVALDLGP